MNFSLPFSLHFKRGSPYTRKALKRLCEPNQPVVMGGDWATGYVRVDNDLLIFMNIGIPGRTGDDFDNQYDIESNTIIWYGKKNSHSGQPTFRKLLSGELKPHYFARWDSSNTQFIYLGIGSIIKFEDGVSTKQGSAIRLVLTCADANEIIDYSLPQSKEKLHYPDAIIQDSDQLPTIIQQSATNPSSFLLEKHLEDYIERHWDSTSFGQDYDIYQNGRQYATDTGPLDILAQRKDKKEYLVLELKRDKASDVVVGQTLRYMGYIQNTLAKPQNAMVRGCIVASQEDKRLVQALSVVPNIDFYRYKLSFSLDKVDT